MIECQHLWSQPDAAGVIQCAWCGKIVPAPIQWVSDTTAPLPPQDNRHDR